MTSSRLELRPLVPSDEPSFREAVADIRNETPPWNFAVGLDDSMAFADYIRRMEAWAQGKDLPPGFVPASFYVGVVDGRVVGRLAIRHRLNEFLLKVGGHIGYGVRPTERRRGYATEMLRQSLPLCAGLGIARALLTCDVTNSASRTVIERCGGVFENTSSEPTLKVQKHRFWISTG